MKINLSIIFIILHSALLLSQGDITGEPGRVAPNFKLQNIENENIELNKLVGTGPILICFWSSCCRSAVAQVEAFSDLYIKYKDDSLTMIAIATDDEKTIAKVKPYAKLRGYNFQVLYDIENETARLYYAFDVPFSVLIDREGKIIYSHLGYMKGDEINVDKIIRNLLRE